MFRNVSRIRVFAGAFVVAIATLFASCGESAKKAQQITLLVDWFPEPTYLGIYYAEAKGFFSEAGISIKIENVQGANRAVAAVAAGQYKISTASGSATVLSFNQYQNVVSLGVLYPKVASAVYGLTSSGIKTAHDLVGRKVGIYPGSINNQEFNSFLKASGVNPSAVEVVAISGSDVALILEHKIDAAVNYRELSPVMLATQLKTKNISDGVWSINFADHVNLGYGMNVISSRDAMANQLDLVKATYGAIAKGYREGCLNKDDAVASFIKRFPEVAVEYVSQSWNAVCAQLGNPIGVQSAEGWAATITATEGFGLIAAGKVKPSAVLP